MLGVWKDKVTTPLEGMKWSNARFVFLKGFRAFVHCRLKVPPHFLALKVLHSFASIKKALHNVQHKCGGT